MASEERRTLERVLDEISSNKMLGRSNWERLYQVFGERFTRAWRLIQEKRVKKYVFRPSSRIIWIVIGQGREYQIYPFAGYCACDDFYFRVIDGEAGICYHLLGQKLAESLNSFDSVEEDDEAYRLLVNEWRSQVRSGED